MLKIKTQDFHFCLWVNALIISPHGVLSVNIRVLTLFSLRYFLNTFLTSCKIKFISHDSHGLGNQLPVFINKDYWTTYKFELSLLHLLTRITCDIQNITCQIFIHAIIIIARFLFMPFLTAAAAIATLPLVILR